MPDIADSSDERIQIDIESGVRAARKGLAKSLPKGVCAFCDEPTEAHASFCPTSESDCRDRYEREQRIRAIRGHE